MRDDTQAGRERPVKFGSLSACNCRSGHNIHWRSRVFLSWRCRSGIWGSVSGRDGDLLVIKGAPDRGATKKGEIISFDSRLLLSAGQAHFLLLSGGMALHSRRPHV
jgi:hypothetical protein